MHTSTVESVAEECAQTIATNVYIKYLKNLEINSNEEGEKGERL